jgi:hypothetical protein
MVEAENLQHLEFVGCDFRCSDDLGYMIENRIDRPLQHLSFENCDFSHWTPVEYMKFADTIGKHVYWILISPTKRPAFSSGCFLPSSPFNLHAVFHCACKKRSTRGNNSWLEEGNLSDPLLAADGPEPFATSPHGYIIYIATLTMLTTS